MESPGPAFRGTSHFLLTQNISSFNNESEIRLLPLHIRSIPFGPVITIPLKTPLRRNFPDMPGANCRLTLMGSTVVGGNSRLSFIRSYPVFSHDSGTSSYGE